MSVRTVLSRLERVGVAASRARVPKRSWILIASPSSPCSRVYGANTGSVRTSPHDDGDDAERRRDRGAGGDRPGDGLLPLLEVDEAVDVADRDWFYRRLEGMDFLHTPVWLVVVRLLRSVVQHPSGSPS